MAPAPGRAGLPPQGLIESAEGALAPALGRDLLHMHLNCRCCITYHPRLGYRHLLCRPGNYTPPFLRPRGQTTLLLNFLSVSADEHLLLLYMRLDCQYYNLLLPRFSSSRDTNDMDAVLMCMGEMLQL